ncbi:hypothetical protein HDU76_009930 [Blyttiomyces sp. JEL0837]|nr:hypothetical protein HDU76_009930 [Blyttiomyces sp. JEL0837]
MLALVGGSKLMVGRNHEDDYPKEITHLPILTGQKTTFTSSADVDKQVSEALAQGNSLYTLNTDLLSELKPNVILTQDLCNVCAIDLMTVERVAKKMVPEPVVVTLNPLHLYDVLDNILEVGKAVGLADGAVKAKESLEDRIKKACDVANEELAKRNNVRRNVLFMEWTDPIYPGGPWTPQLIHMAGGTHPIAPPVGDKGAGPSVRVTHEAAIETKPELLIICPCGLDLAASRREAELIQKEDWFKTLTLGVERMAIVDGNQMFNRPGPRLVDALEFLVAFIWERTLSKMPYTIVVHGGAWAMDDEVAEGSVKGLKVALEFGIQMFKENPEAHAIDVAQKFVNILEDDPVFDAGTGSMLTNTGEVEMDALIATDDLKLGSVACLKHCKNAIDVARLVRDKGGPGCIMVVGKGAETFAREHGIPEVTTESLLVERELNNLRQIREGKGDHLHGKGAFVKKTFPEVPSDTVGCIIRDSHNVVAVAVSTGGTPFKRPGRIGDSPLWGSGGYAYDGIAAASTGFGEDLMRLVMAKSVVDKVRYGPGGRDSAVVASKLQVDELAKIGGLGGVIVLGKDGPGAWFNTPRMAFGWVECGKDGVVGDMVIGVEPEDLEAAVKGL